MLKSDEEIVGVTHDDHITVSMPPSPLLGPQIERVVQTEVGQQRGYHSPYAKGNFSNLGYSRRFQRRAAHRRTRMAQRRNAVSNNEAVIADQNVLDDESHDSLPFDDIERVCVQIACSRARCAGRSAARKRAKVCTAASRALRVAMAL